MTPLSEKTPPEIMEEGEELPNGKNGTERKSLREEKPAESSIDFRKFSLGSTALGWCIFLMFLCIILSIWQPDNELVKSGFEAFKLIVMTILGYIFGSNSANKG